MASTVIIIGAIIAAFSAGWALNGLAHSVKNMQTRIAQLEAAQTKHLPYQTAEEIEDAFRALAIMQQDMAFRQDLISNVIGHLQNARQDKRK